MVVAGLFAAITMVVVLRIHLSINDIPSAYFGTDHASHLYKTYLALRGDTHATEWFGTDLFWIAPAYFLLSMILGVFSHDVVAVYKAILVLSDVGVVLASVFAPFSAPALLFSQHMFVYHGLVPTMFAMVLSAFSATFLVDRRYWASFILLVLATLFEPSVSGVFSLAIVLALSQDFLDRRDPMTLAYALAILVFMAGYYLFLTHRYPTLSDTGSTRLWVEGTGVEYTSPYYWFSGQLPSRYLEEIFVLGLALLSSVFLIHHRKYLLGGSLLFLWRTLLRDRSLMFLRVFLFPWCTLLRILLLSFFPQACFSG